MTVPTLARTPSLRQVLEQAIALRLEDLHTAIPARVESYDASTQKVDAKPLIKSSALQEDGTLAVESLPIIRDVPVVFPGAGGFRLTFPVQAGDTVLLVFSEASIDKWLQQGGEMDPGDTRRFHLSDAIAIPGLHPFSGPWTGASTADATIGRDGGPQVVFKDGEVHLGAADGDPATEAVIKGTTYRAQQSSLDSTLSTQFGQIAAAFTALSAAIVALGGVLGGSGAALLLPPAGAAIAAAGTAFASAGPAACATGAAAATAAGLAVSTFEAQTATYLSGVVKTK